MMCKETLTALRVMPIPEAVNLPFFARQIGEDGRFAPGEVQDKPVTTMLDELLRWTTALASMRA